MQTTELTDAQLREGVKRIAAQRRKDLNDYQYTFCYNVTAGHQKSSAFTKPMRRFAESLIRAFPVD
jgi:hypothetical protein